MCGRESGEREGRGAGRSGEEGCGEPGGQERGKPEGKKGENRREAEESPARAREGRGQGDRGYQ